MLNKDRYKTAQERAEAFLDWCVAKTDFSKCNKCVIVNCCDCCKARGMAYWLDLESEEEKLLPCYECGGKATTVICRNGTPIGFAWRIECNDCGHTSGWYKDKHEAIAANNRVAKKCMEVKEGGVM